MLRKHLKNLIYVVIFIIPLAILFLHPKTPRSSVLLDLASRPVGWFQAPVFELKKLFYFRETYDDYMKQRKQVEALKARLLYLQESIDESSRYGTMAEFRRKQDYSSMLAHVIGRDPSNWNASLIIDKGQKDGLKVGLPVVSILGVVGRVFETGDHTAKVVLLSDPSFSVAALVQRTRESGLLTGSLGGICRLAYLTDQADVKVGDRVITSKLSSAFPEGILIGIVEDVQASENSHTVECLVQPAVDLSQIEDVLVIKR
ncbi:MAG: rod shape-determining protein MreC [Candidatus Omnitrophica bacterium]|nr:rod shape-determining protein MreC [Candidatus Omnitrophota bacterium]MBF0489713.1 rod shape-determining protein MreC [Candidatus Omnitrophota bacterium]